MQPSSDKSPGSTTSLAERTATGVIWGAGGAVVYQVFALFVQTALTYFLTKEQYGIYGKAFAILQLSMLVQQVGFNEILLRRRARLHLWASQTFWCALTLGLSGSVVLGLLARPLGSLYADRELTTLLLMMTATPLVRSLLVLPSLRLVQAMRFRVHYGLMLVNSLTISFATLVFAILGLGAKSQIAAVLVAEPLYALILWRISHARVRTGPRPSRWLPLARDLRFVFGSNVARWTRSSIDPLILGLFASASAVGVYFFAQSMAIQIVRVVTLNLSGVLLPALNQLADDPKRQIAAFLRAARALLLVGAPLCIGLSATSSLFVRVFLDAQKWDTLPPVLGILAAALVFRLADEPVQSLINAQGRFRFGFRLALFTGLLYALVSAAGSVSGRPISIATAVACYYVAAGPFLMYLGIRPGGGRLVDALQVFWVPFILAVAAIAPWMLLDHFVPGQGRTRDGLVLAAVVAGSAVTYGLLGRTLQPTGWCELLDRVRGMVPGRLRPLVTWLGGAPAPLGSTSMSNAPPVAPRG